jgi:threonine synthase
VTGPGPWLRVCRRCGRLWPLSGPAWRCHCGGLFDLQGPGADPLETSPAWSLWRYRAVLPVAGDGSAWQKVSLGEGLTPLVPVRPGLWCKLEYPSPTGSFKDRGAAVMMALAAAGHAQRVVVDSSGNAGRAVAAYAARAGIPADVFVPAGTPVHRVAAIEAFGARVAVVEGDRSAAATAAVEAVAASGAWYASHVYRPEFVHGVKTLAFEVWEQLDGPPKAVVVPAGNGTLVQGLWLGFRELAACGRARSLPAIVAVQAERCAPLAGRSPSGLTAASGIAIPRPPRLGEVRATVLASGGRVLTVPEEALASARAELAGMGMAVEPTAAAAWAAVGDVEPGAPGPGPVVVVLSGGPG